MQKARALSSRGERSRIPIAVSIIQSLLFLIHLGLYATWTFFWDAPNAPRSVALPVTIAVLSVSFVAASLLAHQYFNPLVRGLYTIASVWLGLVNFFFLAARQMPRQGRVSIRRGPEEELFGNDLERASRKSLRMVGVRTFCVHIRRWAFQVLDSHRELD